MLQSSCQNCKLYNSLSYEQDNPKCRQCFHIFLLTKYLSNAAPENWLKGYIIAHIKQFILQVSEYDQEIPQPHTAESNSCFSLSQMSMLVQNNQNIFYKCTYQQYK